jgi:hypothetical protein
MRGFRFGFYRMCRIRVSWLVEVEFFAEGLVAVAEVASETVDTEVATTIAIPAPAILPLGFSKDELFLSRGLGEVFYIQVVVGLVCCHGREIIEAGWVCKNYFLTLVS